MKKLIYSLLILFIYSCGERTEEHSVNNQNFESITLDRASVLVVQLDSVEIEKMKQKYGEENFYISADDIMWYNSIMLEKMDSLNIPVLYSEKDKIEIITNDFKRTIVKDSTFSIYTYFYYNGNEVERKDIFDLIEE